LIRQVILCIFALIFGSEKAIAIHTKLT
jgi:hypothetical protein